MNKVWIALSLVFVALGTAACPHARHIAVAADVTFASAVFALDDAELAAFNAHTSLWTQAQHDAANPVIKQALVDVRTVTAAIQATPTNMAVPKGLPDLLTDLTKVQAIVAPIATATGLPAPVSNLATKAQSALDAALAILRQFAGGK